MKATQSHEPQHAHTNMSNNRNTALQSGTFAIVKEPKILTLFPMKKIFYICLALILSQTFFFNTSVYAQCTVKQL
jgi:hypothetical protein